ncbi:MAG: hypothetical protein U0325_23870 [Polyangiales bacterium]
MLRRGLGLLVMLGACRRDVPPPPPPARDVPAVPPAARVEAPPADAGADPCAPRFADTAAATIDDDSTLTLACDATLLAGWWRSAGVEVRGLHPLRDGASWRVAPVGAARPALAVSARVQRGVDVAVALTRDLTLSLAEDGVARGAVPLAALGLREPSSPRLLTVRDGRALVALNARESGAERAVWLVAFGADAAPAASSVLPGALGAVYAGVPSLLTAVVTGADRRVSLQARWLEVDRALDALRSRRSDLAGAWRSDARVALPHRGMEFSPEASEAGGLLVQGVIGAERGAALFVRFGQQGATEEVFLGAIPSALGDVWPSGPQHVARWWDERYRPRTRVFGGAGREAEPGPPLADAFAALRAGRHDRRLRCGGRVWAVTVDRGALRLRPEGCREGTSGAAAAPPR